jgi:hypothetical protein
MEEGTYWDSQVAYSETSAGSNPKFVEVVFTEMVGMVLPFEPAIGSWLASLAQLPDEEYFLASNHTSPIRSALWPDCVVPGDWLGCLPAALGLIGFGCCLRCIARFVVSTISRAPPPTLYGVRDELIRPDRTARLTSPGAVAPSRNAGLHA